MAFIKEINLNSGITVKYHRVVSVNNITNKSSIIEIASYTDKSKRKEEKVKLQNKEPMDIFINTEYLNVPYEETLNVVSAYEYLKALEKFKDCVND